MNIASEMAELHTNDLTNLRLIKSHFLFHEIFLQLLSFLMKMTAMMADARRVRNARRESTKMSTLISSTRISEGHSGRLVAPSSCKMGRHVTQPRKCSNQWFDDHPWVTLLSWAPQSPDMNIIENLWTLLKQEVAKLPAATNREELKERILSAWKNLGRRRDALKNLCDSMPRRVSALVQTRGGPTKY